MLLPTITQLATYSRYHWSDTAKRLYAKHSGFRNDDYGERDVVTTSALFDEIVERGNSDVLDTIATLYPKNQQPSRYELLHSPQLKQYYGWWLTTPAAVYDLYTDSDDEPVTQYTIPDDAILLSDLDTDGVFIATPQPKAAYYVGPYNTLAH